MVVKSEIRHIRRLQQKKYRLQNRRFVAEGIKTVSELLQSSISADKIFCTDPSLLSDVTVDKLLVSEAELRKMSSLQNPNKILGVFNIPEPLSPDFSDWALVLDTVQDPGNLGTIIRLADWFGIRHIICSENTVDCYNPKTLQATMGSIGRVNIVYTDLQELFSQVKKPVYGAFLDGHSIYDEAFPASGLLVLGNEANGISDELSSVITNRITIPQYGARSTESLNVAMATAILLNEVRRPIQK